MPFIFLPENGAAAGRQCTLHGSPGGDCLLNVVRGSVERRRETSVMFFRFALN